MEQPLRVLSFAGSLRKGSYNRALLRIAEEVAPEGMRLEVFDLAAIPLYDADVEAQGRPEPVVAFREAIGAADAVLIATPEYNYSIPGVLKNAIDWASRPPDQPFAGKPLAIMGAGSGLGSARSQYHLRQVCVYLDMHPLNKPEVLVRYAESFNPDGTLKDEAVRTKIAGLLTALAGWTRRLRGA
ncbi:NADPH-dependent FMN reductase [Azospirillum sp. ST 5-10]|uniref:NADPH-dependent FMN reductase n=1 Tax=unclassified Azospirillum TaxID=2630922 RepID=UPI003F4A1065